MGVSVSTLTHKLGSLKVIQSLTFKVSKWELVQSQLAPRQQQQEWTSLSYCQERAIQRNKGMH